MNPLDGCGKPLFFKVANPAELKLAAPSNRKGEVLRTYARSLSVMQKEAIIVSGRTGAVWRLASDEGPYLRGDDVAPCPLSFVTTGMVASYMNETLALANRRGIEIRNLRLVQDNYYTMEGSVLRGTMTGGALPIELTVYIDASSDEETLSQLLTDSIAAAPVSGLIREKLQSLFTLSHNGREISPARALPMGRSAEADPGDNFDAARPAQGDWSSQIIRGGLSPEIEGDKSVVGSSLGEEQSRRLHVRGICTLREDGVKEIEQQLFQPHGSVFHFLSDEAPESGGPGRAPDAATLISAGIAFCFMTQLSRYAKIAKKDLEAYRVVQDTHFSLGGKSSGGVKPGEADPIETHVFIHSGEDDDFARTALDMSEQTCFLHALCRTKLQTKVRVEGPRRSLPDSQAQET